LDSDGPKIIEVNTNAGGLATVFTFSKWVEAQKAVRRDFVVALKKEFELFQTGLASARPLKTVAIVDDNVSSQGLYPEMLFFAEILGNEGIQTFVLSPEDLILDSITKELTHNGVKIDLIYNRMTDFRFEDPFHKHIREAAIAKSIALTPHPAVYVRAADKRNLLKMKHSVIPETHLLKDKSIDDWCKIKKDYVFKPPAGNASKGVYRGDKVSIAKLKTLDGETIVQKFVAPAVSEDESKFDVRVFTRDNDIIGLASRHFTGQVMEMRSAKAGFKEALPDGVCCLPCLDINVAGNRLKEWNEERQSSAVKSKEVVEHEMSFCPCCDSENGCGSDCKCPH
jgi:glutathione synthase/RimK-type ligase-like ATP-grasp enzyme